MEYEATRNEATMDTVFVLTITDSDLQRIRPSESDLDMLHLLGQDPTIEAKLMGLQIYARLIEQKAKDHA